MGQIVHNMHKYCMKQIDSNTLAGADKSIVLALITYGGRESGPRESTLLGV